MKISAKVIAHSKGPFGPPIATIIATFPRYILAELNTHRMFSRNSASSRAIPFKRLIESVEKNPFVPIAWQEDHKGMQGTKYLDPIASAQAINEWNVAKMQAISIAVQMSEMTGVTKQLCNRLIEPFMWHTAIITATEWENFFALRCPKYISYEDGKDVFYRSRKDLLKAFKDLPTIQQAVSERTEVEWLSQNKGQADIHMMALAEAIWDAINESTPKELGAGRWHIPFCPEFLTYMESDARTSYIPNEAFENEIKDAIKVATANCARVSYTLPGDAEKERLSKDDIELHDRLAASGHWSPFEHCAKAMSGEEFEMHVNGIDCGQYPDRQFTINDLGWSGNFRGFIQYRKTFASENIT